jgi:hypothetical protein
MFWLKPLHACKYKGWGGFIRNINFFCRSYTAGLVHILDLSYNFKIFSEGLAQAARLAEQTPRSVFRRKNAVSEAF